MCVCVVREFRVVRTLVIRVIAWPADGCRERTAWRTERAASRVSGQESTVSRDTRLDRVDVKNEQIVDSDVDA